MPSEMQSGEYRIEQPKPPAERLTEIVANLKKKAKYDDAIQELNYQQAVDTLGVGLGRGEAWAADRLDALEAAIDAYMKANNAQRDDALLAIKEQLAATLEDFQARGRSAA